VRDLPAPEGLLEAVCAIAREAGTSILEVYGTDFTVQLKEDRSPVTRADHEADRIIRRRLDELVPQLPVLSEETSPDAQRLEWPRYWLVDPLDGTREFLKRNGEFTVNIALVSEHRAVLGVVYAPAIGDLYWGAIDAGAWTQRGASPPRAIRVRHAGAVVRVVGSRSHPDANLTAYVARLGSHEWRVMGSSLKVCLVACGEADVYPRFGPTSEWDTGAAQAILESAGGRMIDLAGQPLRYNTKAHLLNPHFLAIGDPRRDWLAPIRHE
jgi:3'(2'), 5'-bisphosphate nucleotidase